MENKCKNVIIKTTDIQQINVKNNRKKATNRNGKPNPDHDKRSHRKQAEERGKTRINLILKNKN
ncbi:MAG: hypothetical protein E6K54_09035 [Gammaproteobacteria bacterium]|nr:MAG: hypothetical protein E6K54_09035 [Gammaproteobacteria bacterium]